MNELFNTIYDTINVIKNIHYDKFINSYYSQHFNVKFENKITKNYSNTYHCYINDNKISRITELNILL